VYLPVYRYSRNYPERLVTAKGSFSLFPIKQFVTQPLKFSNNSHRMVPVNDQKRTDSCHVPILLKYIPDALDAQPASTHGKHNPRQPIKR